MHWYATRNLPTNLSALVYTYIILEIYAAPYELEIENIFTRYMFACLTKALTLGFILNHILIKTTNGPDFKAQTKILCRLLENLYQLQNIS